MTVTLHCNKVVQMRATRTAKLAFLRTLGPRQFRMRSREIWSTENKPWKGRRVFRLVCNAQFGKGAHEQWVPEHVLWFLCSMSYYNCPYHPPSGGKEPSA